MDLDLIYTVLFQLNIDLNVIEFVPCCHVFLILTSRSVFLVPREILQITFKKDVFINLSQTLAHNHVSLCELFSSATLILAFHF